MKKYAQENRKNLTAEEKKLRYDFLRNHPFKFRRQKSFGCYIVDFFCSSAKLVIELDGSQHFTDEGKVWDENRTAYLNTLGLTVLRFTNRQVSNSFESVCAMIDEFIEKTVYEAQK
ncbi:MAG: endonuclease domain-containing protein [Clostridia bacterium]|nr:endonuclease domain-containing protein [Clostridia bacterium]